MVGEAGGEVEGGAGGQVYWGERGMSGRILERPITCTSTWKGRLLSPSQASVARAGICCSRRLPSLGSICRSLLGLYLPVIASVSGLNILTGSSVTVAPLSSLAVSGVMETVHCLVP